MKECVFCDIVKTGDNNNEKEINNENRYKNKKIFTVQFHPEACPGPEDTAYIFDEFVKML